MTKVSASQYCKLDNVGKHIQQGSLKGRIQLQSLVNLESGKVFGHRIDQAKNVPSRSVMVI
jgi:hypothetical protein